MLEERRFGTIKSLKMTLPEKADHSSTLRRPVNLGYVQWLGNITMKKANITLIGMAGSGKSVVGNILADSLGWKFIDVDLFMEGERGDTIQNILDELGDEEFIKLESSRVKKFWNAKNTVFAPGGSVVYGEEAMELLKNISSIIYISTDLQTIEGRIDIPSHGIVGLKEKCIQEIYTEREVLYEQFANFTVLTAGKTPDEIGEEILSLLQPNVILE